MYGRSITAIMVGLFLATSLTAAVAEETIQIDAPGILDTPGATYVLTKDVTAPRTAFMIKGDGITFDLGGHTVTYGTAIGVDRCSGVFLRPAGGEESFQGVAREGFGGGNRFTLRNGRIVQGQQPLANKLTMRAGRVVEAAGPVPGRSCFAVYVRGCRGLEISDLITEVNSRDTDNLYLRECADVHLHDNQCISSVREITNRHWPGTGVITVVGVAGPMDIHGCVIDGGGQWGIRVSGDDEPTGHLVRVHHNLIRHRSYTTNGYAIGCHAPGMRVFANVVKSIGRGVHLTANNIDFYNNIIEPREKPNPEYPSTRTHGIKLEGPSHTQVHHNFCRVVAEEGFGDADPLDFDCPRCACNRVYKNTIEAIRTSDKYWAASINVIRADRLNLTVVHDNVFRTNHWHLRGDWGGMQGMLLTDNRFEVVGEAADYEFFALKQSSAAKTQDMVFRDNTLVPPADYSKAHLLYATKYTRANVDLTVEWTVHVTATDPAGKPVSAVSVIARDAGGQSVAEDVTSAEGKAELILTDYHLIGNQGIDPCLQRGPYELTFLHGGREVGTEKVDPTEPMHLRVTITEPDRSLYVYAGKDQRLTTGDVAKLGAAAVVVGDEKAKPEVTWNVIKGLGGPKVATPHAVQSNLTFENPKESWLQQAELELTAKWADQTVSDRVIVREDTNITPKAVVTGPKKVAANTIVQLDGSRSTDPRGFPPSAIRYRWRQTRGPTVDLSSNEWIDPIFFPQQPGTYEFELVVSSPIATSGPTAYSVEVTPGRQLRQ